MNLTYVAFLEEFEQLVGDEWTCLFDLYHEKLNLKNRKIATKKFQTIIEGVFKLSQQKGFQAMTLRDLSDETDISMGGLYKYFTNKDQIAEMIHNGMIHMAGACLKIKEYRHKDPVFELNELLARHIFLSERLKKWFYFVFMECRSLGKDLMQDIIASEQFMEAAILQRILDANQQDLSQCTNPDFVASMLKVLLQEWYLKSWKYNEKGINADQYVANLLLSVYHVIQVK